MKKKRNKIILITLISFSVIGYLVYAGLRDTMMYYLTVGELIDMQDQPANGGVRVGGKIREGSVKWDPKTLTLNFVIGDERGTVPVVYNGVVPDSFKQGEKVILEGLFSKGSFKASQIMPTCPSKYE